MNHLGELERRVMEQLWATELPQSVREIHRAMPDQRDLAYTTVMTVLDRLTKKGLTRRQRDGRAYRYQAAQNRDELVAELMHTALEGDLDTRTAALVTFVGRVSPAEAAAMRTALERLEQPDAGS